MGHREDWPPTHTPVLAECLQAWALVSISMLGMFPGALYFEKQCRALAPWHQYMTLTWVSAKDDRNCAPGQKLSWDQHGLLLMAPSLCPLLREACTENVGGWSQPHHPPCMG